MHKLGQLIEASREWASVERGKTLFKKASLVLQQTFDIDAGIIMYRKQYMPSEADDVIQNFWGIDYGYSELSDYIFVKARRSIQDYIPSERWTKITNRPPAMQKIWKNTEIQYTGSWPLVVKEKLAGVVILGRKTIPDHEDAYFMGVCATYLSLVLEMLTLRRIAEEQANQDSVTGGLNRNGFYKQFEKLSQMQRNNLFLGIVDVNDFKKVNDQYGHAKGDSVLEDVSKVLREELYGCGECGRYGGDEFVFAFETDHQDVEKCTRLVSSWFDHKWYKVSVGCALWNVDGTDWDSCFRVADQNLYKVKFQYLIIRETIGA